MKELTRQEANREILAKLAVCIEKYPDWRFNQILQNMGITAAGCDSWYVESTETLKSIVEL